MFDDRQKINHCLSFFCIFIFVITASVGAFIGGLWAALGIGLAVALFMGVWGADKKLPLPCGTFSWLALTSLLLFAAELPLSSYIDISIKTWTQLASIFLPLLALTSPRLQAVVNKKFFVTAVTIAVSIGAATLSVELLSGGVVLHILKKTTTPLTEYNRGMAHLAILAFPLLGGLWVSGKKQATLLLALLLLFPAGLTESHTAKLALIGGGACVIVASYRPLWVRNGLGALAVVLMGWPFYAQWIFSTFYNAVEHMHPSWRHRIEIWDYLSYRISEHPIFGWGLGTTHMLDFTQPHGGLYQNVVQAAPHAHNFITQLWVETGLPGLALGVLFLLLSLRSAYLLQPTLRPFALGGCAAALTISMFGFDFWTDALWAAFALSAFAFGVLQQSIECGTNRTYL